MKIVVIHEVNYLTKLIYEYQIIPEILASSGHEVIVIDYDETWRDTSGRIWQGARVHGDVSRTHSSGKVTVRRPGMIRLPLLSRLSGAVANGAEVFREVARSKTDLILLYGVPTVGVQALLAARFFKVPIFFRSIDVMHQLAPSRLLSAVTGFLERIVYKRMDGVIALTPRLKTYIQSYGVPEERVRVLPSGVDVGMFQSGEKNKAILRRWGVEADDPVILFMGTIYRFSGLDRVISDLRMLLPRYPHAKLLVVGHGEDEARLKEIAARCEVSANVIFTGLQPYADLPDIIRAADVCINPFELNSITKDILPTKLFQYLACGRPVLATELPGMLPFLPGERCGVLYSSLAEFVASLGTLLGDSEWCQRLGVAGESAMRENYQWSHIAATMLEQIAEMS